MGRGLSREGNERPILEYLEPRLLLDGGIAAVHGLKWHDLDGDGQRDDGEPGLANWTIFLDANLSGEPDGNERVVQTREDDPGTPGVDETGWYSFLDLPVEDGEGPITYIVTELLPLPQPNQPAWRQTAPEESVYSIQLAAGEVRSGVNFGNLRLGEIRGIKWEDLDGNGQRGEGEPGLPTWTIFLDANGNGVLDDGETGTTTDDDGVYRFTNLVPGTYDVGEVLPVGWVRTSPSGARGTRTVIVNPGTIVTADFGNRQAEVFGTVFHDLDRDGQQDPGEPGLEDWTVNLDFNSDDGVDDIVGTVANGVYGFVLVPEGEHIVSVEMQEPYLPTVPADPAEHVVELLPGQPLTEAFDFGVFYPPDLVLGGLFVDPGEPAGQTNVYYDTGISLGPGVLGPDDEWDEEVWLVDDEAVDGVGYELLLSAETYTEIGSREVIVTLPEVGPVASTLGDGTVTVEMVRQGMNVVVVVDPFDNVIETDDEHNAASWPFWWDLPDLVVFQGPPEQIGFEPEGQGGRREIILPESVSYTTWLFMAGIPEGAVWTEQVWLGTDADVHLGTDLSQGRWYVKIAAGADIPDTGGPFEAWESRDRVIQFQTDRLELPKNIEPTDLKWIILVDWPLDASGERPVPPEDANPGAVMEWHEMQPGAQTRNVVVTDAFVPIRRLNLVTDEGYRAVPLGWGWWDVSVSDDGRFVGYKALDPDFNERIYMHDRDRDADGVFDEAGQTRTWQIEQGFDGSPADGEAIHDFMISGDGRYVVFASSSTNLVSGDTNGCADVFRHDLVAGQTVRVSVNSAGQQGDDGSLHPSISRDGSIVTFVSNANNFVRGSNLALYDWDRVLGDERHPFAADSNTGSDVFIHYVSDGGTVRVPLGEWELHGDNYPVLLPPPHGTSVVEGGEIRGWIDFTGAAVYRGQTIDYRFTLEPKVSDLHGVAALFPPIPGVRTTSVTVTQGTYDTVSGRWEVGDLTGTEAVVITGVVEAPVLTVRSTTATASGLPGALTFQLVVCPDSAPRSYAASISADGTRVAVLADNAEGGRGLFLYDVGAAQARPAGAAGSVEDDIWEVDISADGSVIAFTTAAPLDAEDTNGQDDVYVIDAAGGDPTRVSVSSAGAESDSPSEALAISDDGRFVVFEHGVLENDLAEGSRTSTTLRDLGARLTFPVAPRPHTWGGTNDSPGISGNGRWVIMPQENRVLSEDKDDEWDLYVEFIEHVQLGEVSGTVFQDHNRNAERDGGEGGAAGVTVRLTVLDGGGGQTPDPPPLVAQSDERGAYRFDGVVAGKTYKVTIDVPEGLRETFPGSAQAPGWYSVEIPADGATGEILDQNGAVAIWPDFGLYPPPDLTAGEPVTDDARFGRQATITYTTTNLGPGLLDEEASWEERLWLIDTDSLDTATFKLPIGEPARYDAVGPRTITAGMPSLGETASVAGRVVDVAMVKAGLRLAVELDTEQGADQEVTGEVEEIDEDNNEVVAAETVDWLLPDLVVSAIEQRPELAFGSELDDLIYVVRNDGDADVSTALLEGEPASWMEQVWLGTDADVLADDDPDNGVWHYRVHMDTFSEPIAPADSRQRTVTPDLKDVQLPAGIDASKVNWYVLMDWPEDFAAAQADPAAVLEKHELDPLDLQDPANAFEFMATNIDLSPLYLSAQAGFAYNGGTNRFEAHGLVQIGFAPPEGTPFQPLITVDGDVWYEKEIISVSGTVTAEIGGIEAPLFSGEFTIDIGSAVTSTFNEAIGAALPEEFSIVGVDVRFDSIAMVIPDGGTLADAQLEIQGGLTLPEILGGVSLDITGDHRVIIAPDGVSITGGLITFPPVDFALFDLPIEAEGMSVEFLTDPTAFRIRGRLRLPTVFNVTVDLAGENFIQISEDGVDVVGTLSAEDIPIAPMWTLNYIAISVDTIRDEIIAAGELAIPTGIGIEAIVGFLQGDLNYLSLTGTGINKPIGTTGVYLQTIGGMVNHIAEADPEPIEFGGTVGATAGPEVSVDLPSWAGGELGGALVELTVEGAISAHHLVASGELLIVGGVITGTADAELNWDKGFLSASAELSALAGLLTFDGSFLADSDFNVTMSAGAALTIPDVIPLFGGEEVASGRAYFQFRNDGSSYNDFIAGWGAIDLPIIGETIGGIRVRFNGDWEIIGADEIDEIGEAHSAQAVLSASAELPAVSEVFDVPSGVPWVMLGAQWEDPADGVAIELTGPGGTFTEADIAASDTMAIVEDLTDQTRRVVLVQGPAAGPWEIAVTDATGLGEVSFHALAGNAEPSIAITAPVADITPDEQGIVTIDYEAFDPDSDAEVNLFYSTGREAFDGLVIAEDLPETDAAGSFQWDTSSLSTGDYYLYAAIDDGTNAPVFTEHAPARIRVVEPGSPPAVHDVRAEWVGADRVRVNWSAVPGAVRYFVSFTDDAAGEYFAASVDSNGAVGEAVIDGLTPGETYRFDVRAVDYDGRIGAAGDPAVGVVGLQPTVPPEAGQWEVFADPGSTYTAALALDASETPLLVSGPAGAALDPDTGLLEWDVGQDVDGWSEVIANIEGAEGAVRQVRRYLLSDATRRGAVGGQVFLDLDGDGVRGFGETGLDGREVQLLDAATGEVLASRAAEGVDADGDGTIRAATERGLFRFEDLTPGDYRLRAMLEEGWEATLPADLTTTLGGSEAEEVNFAARPLPGSVEGMRFSDLDGDGLRGEGEEGIAGATIFLDVNGSGARDQYTVTVDSSDAPKPIPDEATLQSALAATGLAGTLADVDVVLDVDHTYDGDLDVFLTSPAGTKILLFTDVGGGGEGFADTVLDDAAAEAIIAGEAPFAGAYRPEGLLADLAGEDPNGVWTLEVTDDAGSDVGTLNGWTLVLKLDEPAVQTDDDDPDTPAEDETGHYVFASQPSGTYTVIGQPLPGFVQIEPPEGTRDIELGGGEALDGVDFADMPEAYIPPTVVQMVMNDQGQPPSAMMSLAVTFSQDVSVARSALTLHSATDEDVDLEAVSFDYNADTHTATWASPSGITVEPGYYTARLSPGDITNAAERPLDGNGDYQAGDDYERTLLVTFPGDATLDGKVNYLDYLTIKRNFGVPSQGDWTKADFNADGAVDRTDFMVMVGNFGRAVDPPAAPAGTTVAAATALATGPVAADTSPQEPESYGDKGTNQPLAEGHEDDPASTAAGSPLASAAEAWRFTEATVPAPGPRTADVPTEIPSVLAVAPVHVGTGGLLRLHDPDRAEPPLRSEPILSASAPVGADVANDAFGTSVLEPPNLDVLSLAGLLPVAL